MNYNFIYYYSWSIHAVLIIIRVEKVQSLELALRSSQNPDHKVLILGRSLSHLEFLSLTYYLSKTNENPEERNPYLWRIMTLVPPFLHLLLLLLRVVFRDIKVYFLKKCNFFFATTKKHLSCPIPWKRRFLSQKKKKHKQPSFHPDAYVYLWKTRARGTSPW